MGDSERLIRKKNKRKIRTIIRDFNARIKELGE